MCALLTTVNGRYVPLTAVDRDRTCANAGDGLQNLAVDDVRTTNNDRPSTASHTRSIAVDCRQRAVNGRRVNAT